jgi:hypothetical protein
MSLFSLSDAICFYGFKACDLNMETLVLRSSFLLCGLTYYMRHIRYCLLGLILTALGTKA